MAKFIGTVKLTGPISPTDTEDAYASHMALYGQGGYRSVATLAQRDLITDERREDGMVVYVIEDETEYRLKGGIANSNWEAVVGGTGGTGGSGKPNYYIVTNITEMENFPSTTVLAEYPTAIREIGTTVYVQDTGQEYRLFNGIDNANWKLISDPVLVSGGGSGGTSNNEINNYYFDSIGCLNVALIDDILNGVSGGGVYVNPNDPGNPVVSSSDKNEFSFEVPDSKFWTSDKVYFTGSTEITAGVDSKVYMEYTINGITDTIEILGLIGTPTDFSGNNIDMRGNINKWFGYFKMANPGQINLKVYQTKDGVKSFNANKTLYSFNPNFTILDGTSNIPLPIVENAVKILSKDYQFNVINNTNLNVSLVKVNTTPNGIDTANYFIIPNTTKPISASGLYSIDFSSINRLTFIDSSYALLVTGIDNGNTIPKYFYGPFNISLNELL